MIKICNLSKSQLQNITNENTNYLRLMNTADTKFTQNKTQLLSKGLKYNLRKKQKNCLGTLELETIWKQQNNTINTQSRTSLKRCKRKIKSISTKKWKIIIDAKTKFQQINSL